MEETLGNDTNKDSPASKMWIKFTKSLVERLYNMNPDTVFIFMGKYANYLVPEGALEEVT
jgi:uracil DNA glycosylase